MPIALVLNELILNAVKHGGQAQANVSIALCRGPEDGTVRITIGNTGHFAFEQRKSGVGHSGLHLIEALMPRHGARILRKQLGDQVMTTLELESPVVFLGKALTTPAS